MCFFLACITLLQDVLVLLDANSKSLFVGVNKGKPYRGANLSTREIVRCLILILSGFIFHSILSIAFLARILFQQEQNKIDLQGGLRN